MIEAKRVNIILEEAVNAVKSSMNVESGDCVVLVKTSVEHNDLFAGVYGYAYHALYALLSFIATHKELSEELKNTELSNLPREFQDSLKELVLNNPVIVSSWLVDIL